MLAELKLKALLDLINSSSREEIAWMNGYLTGLMSQESGTKQVLNEQVKSIVSRITIAYGTETGNSKKLATSFAAKAKTNGINAKLISLDQYRLSDLSKEEYFFAVISTQGDGEPPAAAKKFYDHIHLNGFRLDKLKYSVLALGDTAYPLFCKAGEAVDAQLQYLGGKRIVPLQKCDTDYDSDANEWFNAVMQSLSSNAATPVVAGTVVSKKTTTKKTYIGTVLSNINLNDRGSNKATHHIEISADDLDYQPGDSIGIVPRNIAATADAIIALTGIKRNDTIHYRNESYSFEKLLYEKLNIVYLPERVVKAYANIVQQEIPATRIDLLDLLKIYPVADAAQFEEVIGILEPIAPRLYSIASSPEAHTGEVHITVAKDSFSVHEETKYGLCSHYLSNKKEQEAVTFYVHKNNQFRLPAADKDIIMIGPGTGIAPFRSFISERDATGASGKNWLFFGEQHFGTDFLYQSEIQRWVETGTLTKVNVAFSRDQKDKIYVQHRMLEQGAEFYRWLQSGAYIYVCGSKTPMSDDVEHAIVSILQAFGKLSKTDAIDYIEQMKEEGRYLKDVY